MQSENIFIALLCTVLCFFLLELIWGTSGLYAYNNRAEAVQRISENVQSLQERNNYLLAERHLLETDYDYLLRFASNFAYFREGQHVIKADLLRNTQAAWEIGRIQYATVLEASDSRPTRAVISVIAGMIAFLLANLMASKRYSRQFRLEVSDNTMHHAV
ncbi:FtsB family cell division protein [Spirochaeta dissipatitropha]